MSLKNVLDTHVLNILFRGTYLTSYNKLNICLAHHDNHCYNISRTLTYQLRTIRQNDENNIGTRLFRKINLRTLKTGIITSDNIVKSPFEEVSVPNCLIHECVWNNVHKWSDKIAIECGITGRKYTFGQLRIYAKNFATSMLKSGFKCGQVVSLILPNVPEYPIALFGASEAGLVVSPVNPAYTVDEICHQLLNSKSECVITFADKLSTVKEAIKLLNEKYSHTKPLKIISIQDYDGVSREYDPDVWSLKEMFECDSDSSIVSRVNSEVKSSDVVLLPYSSGTTGLPKGVCLTHRNIVSNAYQLDENNILMNQEPEGDFQDISPVVLPFYHIYGLVIILIQNLRHGGKTITLPKFDPNTYIKTLNSYKSTILYTVPPIVIFLGNHSAISKKQFERVRFALSAAAPIGLTDIEKLLLNFPENATFKQCYGLTETSPVVLMCKNENDSLTSVGPPIPLTEAKVIDVNTGNNLGIEEKGELCVFGPQVMKGYFNKPEATAEMIDKDGWLHTGDIGYFDENGCFYIVDRIKELIKVKGFQVAPAELEEILRSHTKVSDAAVIGIPDPKAGEVPLAFVVPKPGNDTVSADELKSFVSDKVTKYKRIVDVIFVENIPKNPSGKILRRKIRDSFFNR